MRKRIKEQQELVAELRKVLQEVMTNGEQDKRDLVRGWMQKIDILDKTLEHVQKKADTMRAENSGELADVFQNEFEKHYCFVTADVISYVMIIFPDYKERLR